ncbi:hypothetical protein KFK09_014840 [Dendrobium nobile]|uniref:Uncharacterized protein n=1 Tax=Dendrobium nobile TaxID=94219 RepID=A0A8T3B915_DENNO|nr:hypothetical protein KFK09_014840 [Dendrobium nobile]
MDEEDIYILQYSKRGSSFLGYPHTNDLLEVEEEGSENSQIHALLQHLKNKDAHLNDMTKRLDYMASAISALSPQLLGPQKATKTTDKPSTSAEKAKEVVQVDEDIGSQEKNELGLLNLQPSKEDLKDFISHQIKESMAHGKGGHSIQRGRPYLEEFDSVQYPKGFVAPFFKLFDGVGNPYQYLAHLNAGYCNIGGSDALIFRKFVYQMALMLSKRRKSEERSRRTLKERSQTATKEQVERRRRSKVEHRRRSMSYRDEGAKSNSVEGVKSNSVEGAKWNGGSIEGAKSNSIEVEERRRNVKLATFLYEKGFLLRRNHASGGKNSLPKSQILDFGIILFNFCVVWVRSFGCMVSCGRRQSISSSFLVPTMHSSFPGYLGNGYAPQGPEREPQCRRGGAGGRHCSFQILYDNISSYSSSSQARQSPIEWASSTKWEQLDDAHFQSYSQIGIHEEMIKVSCGRRQSISSSFLVPTMYSGFPGYLGNGYAQQGPEREPRYRRRRGAGGRHCSFQILYDNISSYSSSSQARQSPIEWASSTKWEELDDAHFQSYSQIGIHEEMIKVISHFIPPRQFFSLMLPLGDDLCERE